MLAALDTSGLSDFVQSHALPVYAGATLVILLLIGFLYIRSTRRRGTGSGRRDAKRRAKERDKAAKEQEKARKEAEQAAEKAAKQREKAAGKGKGKNKRKDKDKGEGSGFFGLPTWMK